MRRSSERIQNWPPFRDPGTVMRDTINYPFWRFFHLPHVGVRGRHMRGWKKLIEYLGPVSMSGCECPCLYRQTSGVAKWIPSISACWAITKCPCHHYPLSYRRYGPPKVSSRHSARVTSPQWILPPRRCSKCQHLEAPRRVREHPTWLRRSSM